MRSLETHHDLVLVEHVAYIFKKSRVEVPLNRFSLITEFQGLAIILVQTGLFPALLEFQKPLSAGILISLLACEMLSDVNYGRSVHL